MKCNHIDLPFEPLEGLYPTEEFLEWIKNYDIISGNVFDFIGTIIEYWWMPNWGVSIKRKYKGIQTVYMSTGGWSGNEDIISAMMENHMFLSLYWQKSRRGGHYTFKLRELQ